MSKKKPVFEILVVGWATLVVWWVREGQAKDCLSDFLLDMEIINAVDAEDLFRIHQVCLQ